MPRKKLIPDDLSTPSQPTLDVPSETPAPKPTRGRARKTPVETAALELVALEPVVAEKPKRGRKTAEAPVVAEPVLTEKPKGRKTKAAPVPVEEPKPKRTRKPKAEPMVEAPVAATLPETAPEPVVPESVVEEIAQKSGSAYSLGDGRELAVTFRPRAGAKPSVVETAPEAVEAPAAEFPAEIDGEPLPTVTFRPRAGSAKTPAREKRPEPKAVVEKPVVPAEPLNISDDEIPVISWRPKGSGSPTADPEAEEAPEGFGERDGRRRRRGRGGRDEETPSVVAEEAAPEIPKPLVKPPLAIPPDAPQVVLRDGVPVLVRDGKAFPPLAFSGDPRGARQEAITLEQIRMAAIDGVHVHLLRFAVEVDQAAIPSLVEQASSLLAKVAEVDAEAQTILFVEFAALRDAERRFPDAVYRRTDGRDADPSVCDDAYWGEAAAVLRGLAEALKDNPRVMGVQLDQGWHHPAEEGYDTSRAAASKFRAWARKRYGNDVVALRAAWFDGSVSFDNLTGPDAEEAAQATDRFIRSGRRQRRAVDFHLFLSDATAARLSELAMAVKEASEGCLLVGVDYGSTLEGSHPSGGHLALGKVMRTPEIDFVAGPPSYASREAGGSAAFAAPVDSFPLNGKLYLSVEDYRTSLGGNLHLTDEPGNPVLRTPQALESLHWRGVGAALAHGMGVAWTDAGGEGSLRSNSVWDRANRVLEALTLRMATPMGDPEVAVFIDERALAYLVDGDAFELLVQDVRESILRAGVSAAFYLLSDLAHRERFPDSKLYVFLNAWDIRPESRDAIKTRLQRDGKVLFWIYAAGLFDAGRDSLERAREVTGIALKPQPFASKAGTTLLNRRHPLTEAFDGRTVSGNAALEPTYFAIPEDATVLGEYTQTGLPSFVVRDFGGGGKAEDKWTSVFLGEPKVTPALVRALAQMAGAHVWDFEDDLVHVRPPFLTVHCRGTGGRTIALPAKEVAYDLVTKTWVQMDGANLRFIGVDGATHAFLVGSRPEIEHLLSTDPETTLRVESLPPRELNVRQDASDFDVPIMKLGEFMGGAEGEDTADEWFLRPNAEPEETAVAAQAEETDQVGRRRRRRGGRGGRDRDDRGSLSTASESFAPPSEPDLGISVVFRKRQ